jgi:ankyrin repeat protein
MNAGAEVNEYVLHSTYTHVRTVLPAAVEWGYRPLILDIIGAGAEVNAINDIQGKTALAVAVEKRDKLNVQTLIEAGSDVNAPANMNSGRTALIAAVQNNDIAMVGYLLGVGAHIDERSFGCSCFGQCGADANVAISAFDALPASSNGLRLCRATISR